MQECVPDFSPLLDWQCPGCFALNGVSPRARHRSENYDEYQDDDAPPHCEVCGDAPLYASSVSTAAQAEDSGQYWPDGSEPVVWDGGWEPVVTTGRTGSSYHFWRQPQLIRPSASRPPEPSGSVRLQQPKPQHRPVAADFLLRRDLEEAVDAERQPTGSMKKPSSGSAADSSSAGRQSSGSTDSSSSNNVDQRRAPQAHGQDQADDPAEELRRLLSPGRRGAVDADVVVPRPRSPAPALAMAEAVRAADSRRRSANSPPSSGATSSARSGHAADCAAGRSARHARKP